MCAIRIHRIFTYVIARHEIKQSQNAKQNFIPKNDYKLGSETELLIIYIAMSDSNS